MKIPQTYTRKPPKDGCLIYHLTSLKNIPSILRKGLLPRSKVSSFNDIADEKIIDKRKLAGLLDYIPFHFFSKNPFDGAVLKGNQEIEFVYITLLRNVAAQLDAKILPIHPLAKEEITIFDYNEGMQEIDWDEMERSDYSDSHCKNVCMAECLIHGKVELSNFHCIYTKTEEAKKFIDRMIKVVGNVDVKTNCRPNFFIKFQDD